MPRSVLSRSKVEALLATLLPVLNHRDVRSPGVSQPKPGNVVAAQLAAFGAVVE